MSIAAAVMVVSAAVMAGAVSHAIARYVSRRALFPDRPNGRSSHRRTTPRSGGFAIIGGFAVATALYGAFLASVDAGGDYAALVAGALAAFGFGALDDRRRLGARVKLLAQVVIAVAFVVFSGAVARVPLPFVGETALGWAAAPLTVFWIVAFMNAFNFMDGVNGIAGACAVFVLSAMAVAAAGSGEAAWAAPAIFLACALFGFLPLNFPAARLFMGDGGSQCVGFSIAALAALISSGQAAAVTPLFVPIAFMPFLFDVFFTLAHRVRRRCNILEAHKEHVYQLLVRMGRSHHSVTTLYLTLTVVSTTFAIVANAMSAKLQFLAPLVLIALFLPPALALYRRAAAQGLLDAPASRVDAPPVETASPLPAAAE